jgi:hypothetical protein
MGIFAAVFALAVVGAPGIEPGRREVTTPGEATLFPGGIQGKEIPSSVGSHELR